MNMFCSKCWTFIALSIPMSLCLTLIRIIGSNSISMMIIVPFFGVSILLVFRWEIICMCVNTFNERAETISSLGHRTGLLLKIALYWICTEWEATTAMSTHKRHFILLNYLLGIVSHCWKKEKRKALLLDSIRICIEGKKK